MSARPHRKRLNKGITLQRWVARWHVRRRREWLLRGHDVTAFN